MPKPLNARTLAILADLRTERNASAVAARHGVSRGWALFLRSKYRIPRPPKPEPPPKQPRGYPYWSDDERQYLIDHIDERPRDIADHLGRTVQSVRRARLRLVEMGIASKRGSRWSEPGSEKGSPFSEEELIVLHDSTISHTDAARAIVRPVGSVDHYRKRNGIKLNIVRREPRQRTGVSVASWTNEEIQFLLDNPTLSVAEQAQHLNRTPKAIKRQRSNLVAFGLLTSRSRIKRSE